MIQALHYEPQGQRQRFEPREQQEQDRHIHLHLHLNLTLRARPARSTPSNASRITRILAALVAATVMPLWLFGALAQDGTPNTLSWIAGISFLAGLVLAWGFGCLPLWASAWRSTPRVRLLLVVLLLILFVSLQPGLWLLPLTALLGTLSISLWTLAHYPFMFLVWLLPYVHPLISALLLVYVSRQARALRLVATAESRLSSVVVSGMLLMVLGGLLLNLSALLASPLLFLPAMCVAVIIAIRTLFGLSRSREYMQARPKDASPFDVDSSQETREDRG